MPVTLTPNASSASLPLQMTWHSGSGFTDGVERRTHNPAFSIPLISVTHAHDDDDDAPLAQAIAKNKAAEARDVVETTQSVLEENIAGIDECE